MWPVLLRHHRPSRDPAETIHAAYAERRRGLVRSTPAAARSASAPGGSTQALGGPGITRAWYAYDMFAMSVQMLARHGRWVHEHVGVPPWRQWLEMTWLAVWLPSMPENYYKFEWYRPELRRRAPAYLHRYEMKNHVYRLLAPTNGAVSLANKAAFASHAILHGLPVPRTVATFRGGRLERVHGLGSAALQQDLFIKPIEGKGGRGADRLTYVPGQTPAYHSVLRSAHIPLEGLAEHLASLCTHRRYANGALIQARLRNHPAVAPLAGEALSTCRLITILDEHDEPEPVIAIFRMAQHDAAIVDNSHAGGMAAPVDLLTGSLGEAAYVRHDGSLQRFAQRESTGAPIAGSCLPQWEEVVQLALRAHDAFRPWILIGWDIAITPEGPVLVEANDQPCTDGLQRRHRLALGDHRFGELIAYHLGRLHSRAA